MIKESIDVTFRHRLLFTDDVAGADEPVLARVLRDAPRRLGVIDEHVAATHPRMAGLLERHCGRLLRVTGGEAAKRDAPDDDGTPCVWRRVLQGIADEGICRHSAVVVAGGGAVLDATGFAAATAHRGVRLVRLPTTTLAQADSGVGVKAAVNAFDQKNFLGAFAVPFAVLNDAATLTRLPMREWRCGLAEAVKVALLKDPAFFDWLEAHADALANRDEALGQDAWRRAAQLHLDHIAHAGDPFEHGSSRPLDFGHWAAHRLETLTRYALRHGEAVAIGLAIDLTYGQRLGLTEPHAADRAVALLHRLGFDLAPPDAVTGDHLLAGIEQFRQHLGGPLSITLLKGIGRPVEAHEIDTDTMRDAIRQLADGSALPQPTS